MYKNYVDMCLRILCTLYKTVLLFCKFQNGGRVCGSFAANVCVVCHAAALH